MYHGLEHAAVGIKNSLPSISSCVTATALGPLSPLTDHLNGFCVKSEAAIDASDFQFPFANFGPLWLLKVTAATGSSEMGVAGPFFCKVGPMSILGQPLQCLLGGRDSYCRIKMVHLLLLNSFTVIRLSGCVFIKGIRTLCCVHSGQCFPFYNNCWTGEWGMPQFECMLYVSVCLPTMRGLMKDPSTATSWWSTFFWGEETLDTFWLLPYKEFREARLHPLFPDSIFACLPLSILTKTSNTTPKIFKYFLSQMGPSHTCTSLK